MKFNFKIQPYQTDAVDAVVKVFAGQGYVEKRRYIRDLGQVQSGHVQTTFVVGEGDSDFESETGYRNEEVSLSTQQLLKNIQTIQSEDNLKISKELNCDLGCCSLDVEMETGTGKTYVYIKTMFELNKRYGWSKFIVVVPSIAIREGVKKSFEITVDHIHGALRQEGALHLLQAG